MGILTVLVPKNGENCNIQRFYGPTDIDTRQRTVRLICWRSPMLALFLFFAGLLYVLFRFEILSNALPHNQMANPFANRLKATIEKIEELHIHVSSTTVGCGQANVYFFGSPTQERAGIDHIKGEVLARCAEKIESTGLPTTAAEYETVLSDLLNFLQAPPTPHSRSKIYAPINQNEGWLSNGDYLVPTTHGMAAAVSAIRVVLLAEKLKVKFL